MGLIFTVDEAAKKKRGEHQQPGNLHLNILPLSKIPRLSTHGVSRGSYEYLLGSRVTLNDY